MLLLRDAILAPFAKSEFLWHRELQQYLTLRNSDAAQLFFEIRV
jgi:hypothetical protein